MDAANYINTLDKLDLNVATPGEPTFGIVDLAADEQFLSRLYGGMTQVAIEWYSLLLGSSWQSAWEQGPILLDLTASPDFTCELIDLMETKPLGVLIQSCTDIATMLERCQRWLFNSDASILRFYEPRMLTPLIAAMSPGQRHDLIRPGECWAWHNGYDWKQSPSTDEKAEKDDSTPRITAEQLRDVQRFRHAAHAREYAQHYRGNLSSRSDPQAWVLGCLINANEWGFKTRADQERWLRLAIRNGNDFYRQEAFQAIMEKQALTPEDQLAAMESKSEVLNA
ncbi:DUF4123 domain-containing protein [Marinobacter sp. CHS3-4]|uniref:DUF4123 domain-containing protein n=1 Tax=Marinobacter sp. CHS3-4 TaxID=3045174 RepID=UPI0024B5EDDA|nr:DUF4123 domain-containing protein [Marinobacter sp. CHS3-4]MDI9246711.1 DUF4123 domain-containing protein [Marinobacter sp. CHS3-4]